MGCEAPQADRVDLTGKTARTANGRKGKSPGGGIVFGGVKILRDKAI